MVMRQLAHLVRSVAGGLPVHVLGVELVRDADVEVAMVLLTRLVNDGAGDCLASLNSEDVLQVEDGLFPVGIFGVGAGREADGLVASGELNVEPGDECVDEVAAAHVNRVVFGEG